MGQVIKILLFIGIAIWLLFRIRRALTRSDQSDTESGSPPPPEKLMSACATCGIFVPDNEIIRAHGKFYCCAEHRDQDKPA